ncbi:MAG: ABC transporter substrate-binding protein [Ktedonobacteraceae bacterium]
MSSRTWQPHITHTPQTPLLLLFISMLTILFAACGGSSATPANGGTTLATKQVLAFPNVGISDIGVLDPSGGPDGNSALAVGMIYSGLVRSDKNLNVIPDQATWRISDDKKTYTFTIKPNITFSDGTPVTAQTYVYTWTRALLPEVTSPIASFFEAPIVGSDAVANGKSKTLTGVKAIDDHTLQVTLTQPTPYFLEDLTTSVFFALNQKLISQYGQKSWIQHAEGVGVGTGPFMIKAWNHNAQMVLVPNPHYYGTKTKLTEVDMIFVKENDTAFKAYRAGQYAFVWNLTPEDQVQAKSLQGFMRMSLLQTDLMFFDSSRPPFNNVAVRQAFAYAIDKQTLVHAVLKDSVTVAQTIIPPGMPGYQPNFAGLPFDAAKAKSLFKSVYPDASKAPSFTFTYPSAQVTPNEAAVLQQMWQTALGVQVKLRSVELTAYNTETSGNRANHTIQFGFTQWGADFPDPYDWLTLNLTSSAPNNNGSWNNPTFDQTVAKAETLTGNDRIALYNEAEKIAITDVGWLPLDHQAVAAVIPSWVHGISLNANGLYFDNWSDVYLLQH